MMKNEHVSQTQIHNRPQKEATTSNIKSQLRKKEKIAHHHQS